MIKSKKDIYKIIEDISSSTTISFESDAICGQNYGRTHIKKDDRGFYTWASGKNWWDGGCMSPDIKEVVEILWKRRKWLNSHDFLEYEEYTERY